MQIFCWHGLIHGSECLTAEGFLINTVQLEEKNYSIFRKVMQHGAGRISFGILLLLYLGALFAEFLAPYHYDHEERKRSYCPPTRLHFYDETGQFSLRPFVYAYQYEFNEFFERVYTVDKSKKYYLQFLIKGDPCRLWGRMRFDRHLFGVEESGKIYLLGADKVGRDIFSRILYGSRVSLSIGLIGAFLTLLLGLIIGAISGYFGGRTDQLIMRGCEIFLMIPGFYLMLALRTAFPTSLGSVEIYLILVLIMSFIGWAGMARVIRGLSLSLREKDYVVASRLLGRSHIYIIFRHIIPNTASYAIVATTLAIPGYILGESSLSLLGLGIQDPYASWGNLLSDAMNVSEIRYHPWILIPGLFIFVSVMAFNFLGDALRDAYDPNMNMYG
ncbi:MAG: ABC transporter permease [Chlamydiota bacterium]|nr:ABC transporter permease [Chlamydiota bacterium]